MNLDKPSPEIKESSELDAAVAVAAGIDPNCFYPSINWNDAMEAAANAFPGGWSLCDNADSPPGHRFAFWGHHKATDVAELTAAPTGPLAICGAILKGKETRCSASTSGKS